MCSIDRQSKILILPNFPASKLNNARNIYIYLPSGYAVDSEKSYPVLYMHDGQNIFEPSTSSTGSSWRIHNTADKLISEGKIREIIIVGIEFKERGTEFCHYSWNNKEVGWEKYDTHFLYSIDGKGEFYEYFIINELKPYIDRNFRTLPDKNHTALMGASDGGFVSFNIGIRRSDIFSMIGMISPAFFAMDIDFLNNMEKKSLKLWFDIGEKEPCLLEDTKCVVHLLKDMGYIEGKELIYYQVPNGFHSDKDWGERAEGPLIYFFGDIGDPIKAELTGRSNVGLTEKEVYINPLISYNSGLIRSDLNANYIVQNPEILDINPDGKMIPKREGISRVDYVFGDIKASKEYRVIKELTQTIKVNFKVQVPENTPEDAHIFVDTYSPVNLVVEKAIDNIYQGVFKLPRGFKVDYKIKMLCKNKLILEKDIGKLDIPFRHFYAMEDSEIYCLVKSWGNELEEN